MKNKIEVKFKENPVICENCGTVFMKSYSHKEYDTVWPELYFCPSCKEYNSVVNLLLIIQESNDI